MEKPKHIVRMESELADLDDKITKADDFLHGAANQGDLNRTQVHLLHIQLDAMRSYRRVLAIRIEHDGGLALRAEYGDDNLALGAGDAESK